MTPRPLAFLLTAILLAGCSSSPSEGTGLALTTTTTAAAAPPLAVEPPMPAPVSATCDVTRTNIGTGLGFGVYADRALAETGCFLDALFPDHAWAHSALVEVQWTPAAGTTAAEAWVESDECVPSPTLPCDAPMGSSTTSPLTLVVEGDDYATHKDANLEVQVAGRGAAVQQAFKVTVTLFANATVDPGYTALG